jgi:hypothetical protein
MSFSIFLASLIKEVRSSVASKITFMLENSSGSISHS